MQASGQVFVGVDVSKALLSICVHGSKQRVEIANEVEPILDWLQGLPAEAVIAVESTGRYHRSLVLQAHASGRRVFVLNAQDIYFYAKGLGARGKTDRKDAQVIARYLAEHRGELRPWAPTASRLDRLEELLRCRAGVSSKRSSLRQLLRDTPELQGSAVALERGFDELLADIVTRMASLVDEDQAFAVRCRQLRTIAGVGPLGSVRLAALFSRIELHSSDAAVAFSGLDPRPHDSGAMRGRRKLSKRGDPQLRRQLYLAAFAAARSKAMGPHYLAIKAKGFKPTQALVILARKLLRVALAVWKSGKDFDPGMIGKPNVACLEP